MRVKYWSTAINENWQLCSSLVVALITSLPHFYYHDFFMMTFEIFEGLTMFLLKI